MLAEGNEYLTEFVVDEGSLKLKSKVMLAIVKVAANVQPSLVHI
jgi:hypothetical protein